MNGLSGNVSTEDCRAYLGVELLAGSGDQNHLHDDSEQSLTYARNLRSNGGMFGENDYTNAVHSGPSSFRALLVQSEVAYDVEDRNRRKEHQRVRSTKATPLDISSGRYRLAVDSDVRTCTRSPIIPQS